MIFRIEKVSTGINYEFLIYDEFGEETYIVSSNLFINRRNIDFYDLENNKVASIKQVIPSFEPKYQILFNDEVFAEVKKKFTFFEPEFSVVTDYGALYADGNILAYDFNIVDVEGDIIATIYDSEDDFIYMADIDDEADDELILSILIIFDTLLNE